MIGNIWLINPSRNKEKLYCVGYNAEVGEYLFEYKDMLKSIDDVYYIFGEKSIIISFEEFNNKIKL